MNAVLAELQRRFDLVQRIETNGFDGRPYGWGAYENATLQGYSQALSPSGFRTVEECVLSNPNIRILDLAGVGNFVDNSHQIGLVVGVTASDQDHRLRNAMLKQGRDFHSNRRLIAGDLFKPETWDRITGESKEYDLVCLTPKAGFAVFEWIAGRLYTPANDYSDLGSVAKGLLNLQLNLIVKGYNLLSRGGAFHGQLPAESLSFEGNMRLYEYIDRILGSTGIVFGREEGGIILIKDENSPRTIDSSIFDMNLLGCICEVGCDLGDVRTPEGLRRALFKRAPVKGIEPGFTSRRRNRKTGRITSVWNCRGIMNAACSKGRWEV